MEVSLSRGIKAFVEGEIRKGFCEDCGTRTEKTFFMDGQRKRVKPICPKCGGQGQLIVRTTSIQAPPPPKCIKPRCLWKFFLDVLYCSVLSKYHSKRVEYAQKNRGNIPLKYRTGKDSPSSIKGAIIEILKLYWRMKWLRVRR